MWCQILCVDCKYAGRDAEYPALSTCNKYYEACPFDPTDKPYDPEKDPEARFYDEADRRYHEEACR